MTSTIKRFFTPFKPYWKRLLLLFILVFSIIYYTGYTIAWIGNDWDAVSGHVTSDFEKLHDIFLMIMHGIFLRAFASLWGMAPILVTLAMTLGLISLYFAVEIAIKEGRDHPAVLIISTINGLLLIGWFYYLVLK